jgi:D-alanyl-D-alanine carboxypeptidase/D-alanyl-D-alanine-endopeptidase (penicillin-binding protein 4)
VGDDTAYVLEPYPEGWAVDDPVWEYGAPVSALTLNDNAFTLYTTPAATVGEPATLRLWPAVEYFTVHNLTRTVASDPKQVKIERLPGSRELVISGNLQADGRTRADLLAIDDPALFAAAAVRDALLARGVRIAGGIRSEHRSLNEAAPRRAGVELARHVSMPLAETLRVINKVSQNLHAEIVLREIARKADGNGSREAGLKELAAYLKEIGVRDKQYRFEDASGLSRLTLVTPETINAVLLHMYHSPHREVWMSTLPVGGEDGTLEKRFAAAARASRIRAKTGTISHVSSLSGYAIRGDGKTLGFTVMSNNYNAPHAPVRKVIDRIALALLE